VRHRCEPPIRRQAEARQRIVEQRILLAGGEDVESKSRACRGRQRQRRDLDRFRARADDREQA
jgi:hypothetical protein